MKIARNVVCALALMAGTAFAHQSIAVGSYNVIAGYTVNPAYTGQMNGLELMIRDEAGELVPNLEQALNVVLVGPEGSELTLAVRAGAEPGSYTADFIPTVPGNYAFRISGFIGDVEFEELFDHVSHREPPIMDAAEISLP